ncbi:MAG TPA: SH3 domain-containing protein [Myxococcota bacterium]|nr:SH3 domain-containing protein [Myxococcota bacterium]
MRVHAAIVGLAACLCAATPARADYLGGELRIAVRAGPGLEFKVLRTLPAGASAQKLQAAGEWVQVRISGELDGWIPIANLTNEEPPSVALPRVKDKLTAAESKVSELEKKVGDQTAALEELATLKERNRVLEDDASRANATARWKSLAAGAGIILVGMLVGLLAPRGSGTRSRLKL